MRRRNWPRGAAADYGLLPPRGSSPVPRGPDPGHSGSRVLQAQGGPGAERMPRGAFRRCLPALYFAFLTGPTPEQRMRSGVPKAGDKEGQAWGDRCMG